MLSLSKLTKSISLILTLFRWWEKAKLLQFVNSQEEFNKYNKYLTRTLNPMWIEPYWNTRKLLFLGRMYLTYLNMQWHYRFGHDF